MERRYVKLNKMDKWNREAEEISPETEKIPSYKGGGEIHTTLILLWMAASWEQLPMLTS